MMISNLNYEEIVLLQEILIYLDLSNEVDPEDQDVFDSLYEKVMSA